MSSDEIADKGARKFLDVLRKIGPHSKQILNYSYPPLLYQRGEEEDEDDDEQDCDEEDDVDNDEEPEDTHNSHMLGDSDDMDLPHIHDSDDEELLALEGQLNNPGDTGQAISEDDEILGRLRGVEDGDDVRQLNMLMGGNATNLDGLDREQIEKILDQEYYDEEDGQNF